MTTPRLTSSYQNTTLRNRSGGHLAVATTTRGTLESKGFSSTYLHAEEEEEKRKKSL